MMLRSLVLSWWKLRSMHVLVVTTWLGYPKVGDGSIYVLTCFTSWKISRIKQTKKVCQKWIVYKSHILGSIRFEPSASVFFKFSFDCLLTWKMKSQEYTMVPFNLEWKCFVVANFEANHKLRKWYIASIAKWQLMLWIIASNVDKLSGMLKYIEISRGFCLWKPSFRAANSEKTWFVDCWFKAFSDHYNPPVFGQTRKLHSQVFQPRCRWYNPKNSHSEPKKISQ